MIPAMATACINHPHSRIRLKSERLEINGRNPQTQAEEVLGEIPLRDLDRLIVSESAQITSPALAALLRAEIPVSFLAWNGRFLGGFLPASNHHGQARLRQYDCTRNPPFALKISNRILTAKVYNQRRVLQRLAAAREKPCAFAGAVVTEIDAVNEQSGADSEIAADLAWLGALIPSFKASQTLEELRGYEGASTARYFRVWAGFLPADFPFDRRSTRPPLNPVNACISFGATLLYTESVAFIHAHGLDPALGLLHATEDGRWSLALDLIEPFRPALVEALTLDVFSHQILNATHFESAKGGVYLNEEGRKKFILQYERRMERQFFSEHAGHRTTLRQQLEQQIVLFKSALEDEARFQPFLMN